MNIIKEIDSRIEYLKVIKYDMPYMNSDSRINELTILKESLIDSFGDDI